MRLNEYIKNEAVLSIDEYLNLGIKGLFYDFLKQGIEPDRTALTKQIYQKIYPWYQDEIHGGDTLNTYRSAILRNFYGQSYSSLDRMTQQDIISIVHANGFYLNDYLFEFEVFGKEGRTYRQLCNNYQLGNFGIFPKGKINVARSKAPYNDYFDTILTEIYYFYSGELESETDLQKAILSEANYFNQFEDYSDFIVKNYFNDFFDENDDLILLSEIESFEKYVEKVNIIINKRELRILSKLLDIDIEKLKIEQNQFLFERDNDFRIDLKPKIKNNKFKNIPKLFRIMWIEEGLMFYLSTLVYSFFFGIMPLYYVLLTINNIEPWEWARAGMKDYLMFLVLVIYPIFELMTFIFVRYFWRNHSLFDLWHVMSIFEEHYSKDKKRDYEYLVHESKTNLNEVIIEKREKYQADPIDFFSNLFFIIILLFKILLNLIIFVTAPIVFPFVMQFFRRK